MDPSEGVEGRAGSVPLFILQPQQNILSVEEKHARRPSLFAIAALTVADESIRVRSICMFTSWLRSRGRTCTNQRAPLSSGDALTCFETDARCPDAPTFYAPPSPPSPSSFEPHRLFLFSLSFLFSFSLYTIFLYRFDFSTLLIITSCIRWTRA